jgi:hypothetical protein
MTNLTLTLPAAISNILMRAGSIPSGAATSPAKSSSKFERRTGSSKLAMSMPKVTSH